MKLEEIKQATANLAGDKMSIFGYSRAQLQEIAVANGRKPFLAQQIYEWVYKKRVDDFYAMENIAKANREFLADHFTIRPLPVVVKQTDPDETVKFLFALDDGNKIETVLMKFDYGYSVCVTTQVGCNMGCKFCASGLLKKKRNLETSEMVREVWTVQKYLDEKVPGARISNLVLMGIGEPLDNLENVSNFIDIINDPFGLQIGARKITVSTCGLVNRFDEWIAKQPQVGLAISLHAPNNEIRGQIMPINKAFPFDKVIAGAKKYVEKTNRRITFEYILLDGVNDAPEHARELASVLRGMLCYVNLIPYNEVSENGFQRSHRIKEFAEILTQEGIVCTVRQEKGAMIDAACGQLRAKNEAA